MDGSPRKRQQHVKEEQARLLAEHKDVVKAEAAALRRACADDDLKAVLSHASTMLDELRTGSLTPKLYYELFLDVQSQLSQLESYLASHRATPMHQVYLLVQHASNLIPRLYLQITVGSVYVGSGQAGARDVLAELLQVVMGVQHPMRGLFVRYYLAQCMRDKLPDAPPPPPAARGAPPPPPTPQGTVLDAIGFLLGLLKSMNRLWVRLGASTAQSASVLALGGAEVGSAAAAAAAAAAAPQAQPQQPQPPQAAVRRKRTERERLELRVLLGSILSRLASLENIDLPLYAARILPGILAEVVACKDRWAQAYILEALVQVFPCCWHEATLGTLLFSLRSLQPDPAMVRVVLQGLLGRLSELGSSEEGGGGGSGGSGGEAEAAAASACAADLASIPLPEFPALPAGPARRALRAFAVVLGHTNALGTQAGGAFLGASAQLAQPPPYTPPHSPSHAAPAPAPEAAPPAPALPQPEFAASSGASDEGGSAGAAAAVSAAAAAPAPAPAGAAAAQAAAVRERSAALRQALAASSALEGMVNLLDVYASLMTWVSAAVGTGSPLYCDAILQGASRFVSGVMGTGARGGGGSSGGGSGGGEPGSGSAAGSSASASVSAASASSAQSLRLSARALTALRTLLAGDSAAPAPAPSAAPASAAAAADSEVTLLRAMTTLSSATGVFSLPCGAGAPRPRLFLDAPCSRAVIALLGAAQAALGLGVLRLEHYAPLMGALSHVSKRRVASRLLGSVVGGGARVAETAVAGRLLEALAPLFRPETAPGVPEPAAAAVGGGGEGAEAGGSGGAGGEEEPQPTFEGEHKRLVELIGLLGSSNSVSSGSGSGSSGAAAYSRDALAVDFAILLRARDAFAHGGPNSVIHTFPPLVHRFLGLGGAVQRSGGAGSVGGVTPRTLFSAVHETTRALAVAGHTAEAARLFCAAAGDASIEPEACQEFISQAHLMYDELPSSKQAPCLLGIIEATRGAPRLTPAMRASLAARACSAAEHVLAKGGAVAALLACARLLADAPPGAPAPALTPAGAVQRALRAADAAPGAEAPGLFVDCLEAALALALPAAFVGELALLCSEYVGWAAKGGGSGGGAALGERFEALRPRVAAVTGRPAAASGAAAAPVAAAPVAAAPVAAAAPAPEAPAQQQPQFSASAAAEDL